MSKGKSQAGTGQSDGYVPAPTGTTTFHKALKEIEEQERVDEAIESLESKGKVETEGSKVSFKNEAGKRTFQP